MGNTTHGSGRYSGWTTDRGSNKYGAQIPSLSFQNKGVLSPEVGVVSDYTPKPLSSSLSFRGAGRVLGPAGIALGGLDVSDYAKQAGMRDAYANALGVGASAALVGMHAFPPTLPAALAIDAGLAAKGVYDMGREAWSNASAMNKQGALGPWFSGQLTDIGNTIKGVFGDVNAQQARDASEYYYLQGEAQRAYEDQGGSGVLPSGNVQAYVRQDREIQNEVARRQREMEARNAEARQARIAAGITPMNFGGA